MLNVAKGLDIFLDAPNRFRQKSDCNDDSIKPSQAIYSPIKLSLKE
jgi:hypothetical protein